MVWPHYSGLPSLLCAWSWCLAEGGQEERVWVGIVCGSVQAYPIIWRQSHLMLEVVKVPPVTVPPWWAQKHNTAR